MRAARVRPHVREGDFFGGPLLEQELFCRGVEEEDGEGAVEETFVYVGHEVAWFCRQERVLAGGWRGGGLWIWCFLKGGERIAGRGECRFPIDWIELEEERTRLFRSTPNRVVVFVEHDAHFVHQGDLGGVVAAEGVVGG